MNAILQASEEVMFYTYLNPIFKAINNRQLDYNWLLTDLELNDMPEDFLNYTTRQHIYGEQDRRNKYWMTGEQITRSAEDHDIQFIWGVLVGFRKSVDIELQEQKNILSAESSEYWIPGATVQHPQAELEIVCWDSSLTMLISKEQSIVANFKQYFKNAMDLDQHLKG